MKTKWLLGNLKNSHENVYLEDFEWSCEWYWSGGYIGNRDFHCHFNGCFLDVPDYRGHPLGDFSPGKLRNGAAVWEDLGFFLDNPQYNTNEWWRIKDLFKQFYILKESAEVFQYGGHCSATGRNPAELNKDFANQINKHIENIIIPKIRKAMNHGKII